MGVEIIIVAGVVLVLNVLDSVTTALCVKQYPDKDLKGEANPFMRMLMLKSKVLAEVMKHGICLVIVIALVARFNDIQTLRLVALLLGLVVVNNLWILVSRAITKRKVASPMKMFFKVVKMPEKYHYIVVVLILLGIAYSVNAVVW